MGAIKDRIIEFIRYEKISKRGFAASIGKSNSYVNNIVSTISADVIQKIQSEYPNLNIDWLLTGNGKMIKGSNDVGIFPSPPIDKDSLTNIDILVKVIDKLSESDERNSKSIEIMNENMKELIAQGRDQVDNITKLVNLLCQSGVDIANPVVDKEKRGLKTSGRSDRSSATDAEHADVG